MAKSQEKSNTSTTVKEVKFTKNALMNSNEFTPVARDIMNIILENNKEYTIAETKKAIEKYKEGF